MLLWDILQGFVVFLVIVAVVFMVLLALCLTFPSARSPIFSFVRWGLRGLWKSAPYVASIFVGLLAGLAVYKVLPFNGEGTRLSLSVALLLVVSYSIMALALHRVKWYFRYVKFIVCLCVMVVLTDIPVGVFLVDELARAMAAWSLSVVLSWLVMFERDTFRTYFLRLSSRRRLNGRVSSPSLGGRDASLINRDRDDGQQDYGLAPVDASPSSHSDTERVGRAARTEESGASTLRGESEFGGGQSSVGSIEIVAIPESYFGGKLQEGGQGEANLVLEKDIASRFRGFVASMMMGNRVFPFKQVFSKGRGRFFIQCRAEDKDGLRRALRDVNSALHSWFPEFETRLCFSDDVPQAGGSAACGWISNLPAPSVNPMKFVAELFIHRRLSGCITVIARASSSALSSHLRKGRFQRLVGKAKKEDQQQPLLDLSSRAITSTRANYDAQEELEFLGRELERMDAGLQAKCWSTLECQGASYEDAENDLDLALRTFVAAYSYEGRREALRWGMFPRRQAEAVHRLTSELVPRGESTVLLPSDLALYFWLPEADTMAKVKRKGEFLSPTREEMASGEIPLGYVLRHGNRTDEEFHLLLSDMLRHLAGVGSSGSGKTWTMMIILLGLYKQGIPFLVLDPVKKEYRCLIKAVPGLRVFTVGDETVAPLRFNILRVPKGVKPQKHVDMVRDAMVASIVMYAPAPYVLQIALNEAFAKNGWDLALGKRGKDVSLLDLKKTVSEIVRREGYEGEPKSTITAALSTRFESLSQGGKGSALCSSVSMSPKELIAGRTVVEFSEIGDEEDRALIILMMLLSVYEYLQTLGPTSEPRCAIVIEEAGALFSNVGGKGGVDFDSKETRRKMVEVVSRITAEIRALGGIMVFVNQSAVSLPLEVTENTSTKIVHQVADDLNAGKVARMLGLNERQKRALTSLEVGRPIVKTPGVSHPFQVEVTPVTEYGVNPTEYVDDEKLRDYMRRTFFDSHPEHLEARTAVARVTTQVPKTIAASVDEESVAAAIVKESGFLAEHAKALDNSREEKNVKPVVHLFLAKAARYTMKLDEMKSTALKIMLVVAHEYHGGAKLKAHLKIVTDFRSELAKIDSWPVQSGSAGAP